MTENPRGLSPQLVEAIAGLTSGTVTTLTCHPLDVIKARLQVHRSTSSNPPNSFTILRRLLTNERPIQSLYRGLTPNLIGNANSWGLFFYIKSITEEQLRKYHAHFSASNPGSTARGRADLSPADYFLASGLSGVMVTIATNPIWVLKTRLVTTDIGAYGAYSSMWQGARRIWRDEGARGFYRGAAIGCLGATHGAVQFAVYEPLKNIWRRYLDRTRVYERHDAGRREEKLGITANLAISAAAKIVAGTVTYPYQVVRSRLQTQDSENRFGKGIRGVVAKVWKEDGIRGFYKGVGTNVIRVLPATWVTFVVYENVKFYLPYWAGSKQ